MWYFTLFWQNVLVKGGRLRPRCNDVFWTGLKIDPGFIFQCWILNLGCFFSVENWDQGSFFNSFANTFFKNFWLPWHVEYWPCWILTPDYRVLNSSYPVNNSPCYQQKFRGLGGWGNKQRKGVSFALIEQFRGRKVNIFSIIIASSNKI
jgi:hypothetical protein